MNAEKFQRLMSLFTEAQELGPDARRSLLDRVAGEDREIHSELVALLGQTPDVLVTGAGLRQFAEHTPVRPSIPTEPDPTPAAGLSGNYRLLRVVGEGGMGVVYEAEQAFPRRRVAIKALRPGLATRGLLRRFQNEAQILGRLHHPGIAQVYEAGTADVEHPDEAFLVMEFVDGKPIHHFAAERSLDLRARVDLVIQVCDAVQHAHQRGVIHRDLKPANILVTATDTGFQPKVLDFGVARFQDDQHQFTTVQTGIGQVIGTLAYMSPEQIAGSTDDIDTRTDVYALGVVLYQVLTGKLPHDLSSRPLPEAARIVRDESPTRIGTLDRALRGDLEVIVLRALEKDRERRYQSAADLGDDLKRYLAGEPILARRDSATYVLSKMVRRHKLAFSLGACLAIGLIAFSVFATVAATRNRALADTLADELAAANTSRGRLMAASGAPSNAERTLWTEFMQRPDLQDTYWALWEYYAKQPIIATTPGAGFQPNALAHVPAKKIVLWAGRDGELQAWTDDLRRCLWSHEPGGIIVGCIGVSPDGTLALAGGDAGRLRLFETATGRVVRQVTLTNERFTFIGWTDDRHIVAATQNSALFVLNPDTLEPVSINARSRDPMRVCMLGPDRQSLFGVSSIGVVIRWSIPEFRVEARYRIEGGRVQDIGFEPGGRRVLALGDRSIHVLTADDLTPIDTYDLGMDSVESLLVRPNGTLLTSGRGQIKTWTLKPWAEAESLPGTETRFQSMLPGPRDGTILTLGMGTAVRIFEDRPYSCAHPLEATPLTWALSLAALPGGKVAIGSDSNGVLFAWDIETYKPICSLKVAANSARSITLRPRHTGQFAVALPMGEVGFFEFTGTEIRPFRAPVTGLHESGAFTLAFTSDGERLVAGMFGGGKPGRVVEIDVDSGSVLRELPNEGLRVVGLDISPDDRTLIVCGMGGVLSIDLPTGKIVARIEDRYTNHRVFFSPDGTTAAIARSQPELHLVEPRTLKTIRVMRGHGNAIIGVGFDPAGELVVTGSGDGTLRFWSVRTGRNLVTIPIGHEISWVRFVPGTRKLLTSGYGGDFRVWDLSQNDRAIAASMSYFHERFGSTLPSPPKTAELLAFARRVTGDPAFTLESPAERLTPVAVPQEWPEPFKDVRPVGGNR